MGGRIIPVSTIVDEMIRANGGPVGYIEIVGEVRRRTGLPDHEARRQVSGLASGPNPGFRLEGGIVYG